MPFPKSLGPRRGKHSANEHVSKRCGNRIRFRPPTTSCGQMPPIPLPVGPLQTGDQQRNTTQKHGAVLALPSVVSSPAQAKQAHSLVLIQWHAASTSVPES